jgi:hypothetical protein
MGAAAVSSPTGLSAYGEYPHRYSHQDINRWNNDDQDDCCGCAFPDDPQAYHASAYRPNITPQLIVGGLIVASVVLILSIGIRDSSRHQH